MVGRQVMYDLRHRPGIDRLSAFGAQEIMLFPKLLIGVLCSQYLPNEFANFRMHCELRIRYGRDGVSPFAGDLVSSCRRPASRWSCSATASWVS